MKTQSLLLLILSVSVIVGFASAQHGQGDLTMSKEAIEYLEAALDIMEENALRRDAVDWTQLRAAAFERAQGAQVPADTHSAIAEALAALGDNHSFFLPPRPSSSSSSNTGTSPSGPSFEEPTGSIVSEGIALLTIPEHSSAHPPEDRVRYAEIIHTFISEHSESGTEGWIIDLRKNGGGNMWPMLAGLGPLLGDGVLGSFAKPDGTPENVWTYKEGASYYDDMAVVEVPEATRCSPIAPQPPVAVLLGPRTASSGEAVAIAFAGRERTRFFGDPTRGLTTGNGGFKLDDGAMLILTVTTFADRTGRVYGGPIVPDQTAEVGQTILDAAIEWIRDQL